MSFLHPLLLLAGLGVALPILAHLLNRYRVQRTPWAAMQFLNRSVRVRSRQLRLRDVLLLLLRCLAIMCLAFAVARPAMQRGDSGWLPAEPRAGVVIALDGSFSMQHGDESPRFDRALEKVRLISESIHLGDPVSVVLLGGEHRVVLNNMAFEPERFEAILKQQKAGAVTIDWNSAAKRIQELADNMEAQQKEIYIVSDFQAQDWSPNDERLRALASELENGATVFMTPIGSGSDNLAITELSLVSGMLRQGTVARYQATVRNCGPNPVSNVNVQCRADGVQVDSKQIPLILPGASETVSLFVTFHNAGATQITAEITDNALPADNIRHVVAVIRERVSVLCVDGSAGDAGGLIVASLLARGDGNEDDDYIVRSVPWLSFPAQDLEQVDVVVFANVPETTPDQTERLSQFVRQGGGFVWFAGDQVKPAEWNARSAGESGGNPLLPGVIGQVVSSSDVLGAGKPLEFNMPEHLLCRPLQSLPEDLLNETRFLKRLEVDPAATSFPVLTLAGSDSPILLEHALGRGHVVMFTTSAEATWNNMALTPVFPMLMQQIVTYLAGREFEQPRVVGDTLSLAYTEQPDASDAVFDTPSEQTVTVPVRAYRDQYVAMLEHAQEAGFYLARVSVQAPGTPIAVNVDTRESEIACLTTAELQKQLEGTQVRVAASDSELVSAVQAARTKQSSWRFFLWAGLIACVLEGLFADRILKRSYRSGNTLND